MGLIYLYLYLIITYEHEYLCREIKYLVNVSLFQARDGRKKVMPHIIESSVSLDSSVLTFLCDAYAEPLFLGLPRQVLRFHRKLAPYKASFTASASSMCL